LTRRRTREQQICDVRAHEQQHEGDDRRQDRQRLYLLVVGVVRATASRVDEKMRHGRALLIFRSVSDRFRRGGQIGVQARACLTLKDGSKVAAHLFCRESRSEPPGHLNPPVGRITHARIVAADLIVEPQRAFRPERLIISRRDGSSATAGTGARVNGIFIGDQPQSPSIEQPAPTEMFQPDATVSGIDFDVCVPGQKIQLQLSVTALPTGTEFIRLSCGMYGDMMRGSSR